MCRVNYLHTEETLPLRKYMKKCLKTEFKLQTSNKLLLQNEKVDEIYEINNKKEQ